MSDNQTQSRKCTIDGESFDLPKGFQLLDLGTNFALAHDAEISNTNPLGIVGSVQVRPTIPSAKIYAELKDIVVKSGAKPTLENN